MELRALRYFVEVVRQKSYTTAAQKLFVTQPTLSRQVADLEDELGEKLLERTTRSVVLTEKGARFYRRAVSILALTEEARKEVMTDDALVGDIRIAAGEMPAFSVVAAAITKLQQKHPQVRCHFMSVTADVAAQNLRLGLADLAVFSAGADLTGFESLPLPKAVRWGVLTARDGALKNKTAITAKELKELNVFLPARFSDEEAGAFAGWAGYSLDEIDCCGTYNLLYNAALAVRQGANALCIEGIVAEDNEVRFVPLTPEITYAGAVSWLATRRQSALLTALLEEIKEEIASQTTAL